MWAPAWADKVQCRVWRILAANTFVSISYSLYMETMSFIRSIPSRPMSSRRPMNGLTAVEPAWAPKMAWFTEKHKV